MWAAMMLIVASAASAESAAPTAEISPRETWSAFFGGEQVKWHVAVRCRQQMAGRLVWVHSAQQRPLSRGESAVALAPDRAAEVELTLRLPEVRPGVSCDTELDLAVVGAHGDTLGRTQRTLRLWPRDAFSDRRKWLRGLRLILHDPVGNTQQALDRSGIKYQAVRNPSVLDELTGGLVVVGEGVSFSDHPHLAATMESLAARRVNVLCLAPSAGCMVFPGTDTNQPLPRSVALLRNEAIRRLDQRLDAEAWPPAGRITAAGWQVTSQRGRVCLAVSDSPAGWPWTEVQYAGGGRLILCGFGIVGGWDASPTPRYLFLRILESLSQNTDPRT